MPQALSFPSVSLLSLPSPHLPPATPAFSLLPEYAKPAPALRFCIIWYTLYLMYSLIRGSLSSLSRGWLSAVIPISAQTLSPQSLHRPDNLSSLHRGQVPSLCPVAVSSWDFITNCSFVRSFQKLFLLISVCMFSSPPLQCNSCESRNLAWIVCCAILST